MNDIEPGTVIYAFRDHLPNDFFLTKIFPPSKYLLTPYKHFGVYAGNDEVIHFAPDKTKLEYLYQPDDPAIIVHKVAMKDFLGSADRVFTKKFPSNRKALEIILKNRIKNKNLLTQVFNEIDSSNYKFFSAEETLARAEEWIGEQGAKQKKYNVIINNCEHFAVWCKTNVIYSDQVSHFYNILLS